MCCLETYWNALKLGVRDYVDELEFTNEDVESPVGWSSPPSARWSLENGGRQNIKLGFYSYRQIRGIENGWESIIDL